MGKMHASHPSPPMPVREGDGWCPRTDSSAADRRTGLLWPPSPSSPVRPASAGSRRSSCLFFFFFFVFVCVSLSRAVRREVSHEQAGGRAGTSPASHGLTDDQDSSSPRVSVGFRSGEGPRLKMDRDNRGPARPRHRHRHTKREESTKVV